jgi:hypothetical protein
VPFTRATHQLLHQGTTPSSPHSFVSSTTLCMGTRPSSPHSCSPATFMPRHSPPDTMDQQSSLSSPPSPPDNAEHASPTITATNSKNLPSTPAHYGGDRSRLLSPGALSFYLGECSSSDHEVEDEHVDDELSPCPAIVMSLPYTLTAPGRKKRRCRR